MNKNFKQIFTLATYFDRSQSSKPKTNFGRIIVDRRRSDKKLNKVDASTTPNHIQHQLMIILETTQIMFHIFVNPEKKVQETNNMVSTLKKDKNI